MNILGDRKRVMLAIKKLSDIDNPTLARSGSSFGADMSEVFESSFEDSASGRNTLELSSLTTGRQPQHRHSEMEGVATSPSTRSPGWQSHAPSTHASSAGIPIASPHSPRGSPRGSPRNSPRISSSVTTEERGTGKSPKASPRTRAQSASSASKLWWMPEWFSDA